MRSENVLPRWKEAIVIFDRQAGDEILDTVAEGLGSNLIYPDIALTIYQLDSMSLTKSFSDQIEGVMQKYTKTSAGNFILVTKSGNVNRVLEVVKANY
jgi:type IV pilus biogenesis protein CpaD/CtpE